MTQRTRRFGLAVAVAAATALLAPAYADAIPANAPKIGMVCTSGSVAGSTRTFNLVANSGNIETPDGNGIFMWSYANADAPDSGHFQSPGPVLCATQGETVVVHLTNNLPEAASIVFPGQDAQVTATGGAAGLLTREAAASTGTVSYSFTAGSPGTYLYESGSDVSKQLEMGLYGALIIRPTLGGDYAYSSTGTQFAAGHEYLLLLSELDPDLHHAVETAGSYDPNAKVDRYFAINGREFPDTIQDNGTSLLPNQPYGSLVRIQPNSTASNLPSLVRMINVGSSNHPFHPHGNHTTQIAQDGRLLLSASGAPASTEHFGETIGAGQTGDYLLRWDDQDNWSPTNPLPVAPPNYRNVFFKDANTWYGASPYLGYKGTLPTGTTSQNICGEWYFPWHSHALNEFSNFDQGFGGMGTLLRVDPAGGCFAAPAVTSIPGGVLKGGNSAALAAVDSAYYQVNPKTTTRTSATSIGLASFPVASTAGFPPTFPFWARIDSEVVRVNSATGTTWAVTRGQLGTAAAAHANGATVSSLANDWYAGFTGVPGGSQNLKVTYRGKNCGVAATNTCPAVTANLPQQTVKICNWTVSGAAGCSTASSNGWVTLPGTPTQPQAVGSTEVGSTWTLPGSANAYIGTGTYSGQVRVLVHTQRYTAGAPTTFSTWGNLMALTYDAP